METDLTRASITEQLHEIPFNTALKLYGDFLDGKNELSATKTTYEGKLTSIDWKNNTLVLRSDVYNTNTIIDISKIINIHNPKNAPNRLCNENGDDWYYYED